MDDHELGQGNTLLTNTRSSTFTQEEEKCKKAEGRRDQGSEHLNYNNYYTDFLLKRIPDTFIFTIYEGPIPVHPISFTETIMPI